jgi:hypothetical protein
VDELLEIAWPEKARRNSTASLTLRLAERKDPIRLGSDLAGYIRVTADPA